MHSKIYCVVGFIHTKAFFKKQSKTKQEAKTTLPPTQKKNQKQKNPNNLRPELPSI